MKRKLLIVSTVLATQLFAQSINFNQIDGNPTRIAPNNNNQILSFNNSIKDSINSIVNISAKKHISSNMNLPFQEMFNDPLFKKFFGNNFQDQFKQKNRVQRSLGSGVILSKNGYIVTNNHVIENADEILVTIGNDKKEYTAKLIGRDSDSDLAVIKIDGGNFSPIKVSSSKSLQLGDVIFAIGNPFGIGTTVTQGIISALNKNKVGINRYENYIQTDASINPGNSGGALVDSRGALIGINTAIISKSGGNNGIGFAIPIAMVKDVVSKLVADGKVTRGYLGVSISDLTPSLSKVYNKKQGALVLDVSKNTPAYKYGLKRGDLIYSVNGKTIKDRTSLQNEIASFKPKDKVKIKLERNKKDIVINIVLADRNGFASINSSKQSVLGGLSLSSINENTKKQFRLANNTKGVLISDVKPKSRAEKIGFQAGDVIIQIEDMEIKTFNDVNQALKKYKNKHKRVYVNRYGQTLLLVIK